MTGQSKNRSNSVYQLRNSFHNTSLTGTYIIAAWVLFPILLLAFFLAIVSGKIGI